MAGAPPYERAAAMRGSSLRVQTTSGKLGIAVCRDRKKRCLSSGSLMLRFSRKWIVSTRSLFRNVFSINCGMITSSGLGRSARGAVPRWCSAVDTAPQGLRSRAHMHGMQMPVEDHAVESAAAVADWGC